MATALSILNVNYNCYTKANRLIALLDIITKGLKWMLVKRVSALIQLDFLPPKTHFDDRVSTLTNNAVHYLIKKTYKGCYQDKNTSSLMLDVTRTLDNDSHKKLFYNLRKLHLELKIVDLISSFIFNILTIIKTNDCVSDNIDISIGILQTSRVSLILYIFYNADLIKMCFTTDNLVTNDAFINDVFFLATSSSILQNCQLLKETHFLYTGWSKWKASKFDEVKYQLVHL